MRIDEAVKKAMETGQYIYRRKHAMVEGVEIACRGVIKPTNSYETCVVFSVFDGKPRGGSRCWNPTADDLTATDWEITEIQISQQNQEHSQKHRRIAFPRLQ